MASKKTPFVRWGKGELRYVRYLKTNVYEITQRRYEDRLESVLVEPDELDSLIMSLLQLRSRIKENSIDK